jgi:hypothetical protein
MPNKKISIDKSNVPASAKDGSYSIRYRILSSDKVQSTEWSEYISAVPSTTIGSTLNVVVGASTIGANYSYNSPTLTITVNFAANQIKLVNSFDFYVSWKTGATWSSWQFVNTVNWTSNSFIVNFTKPAGASMGKVAMFASTYPLLTSTEVTNSTSTKKIGNMNYVFVDNTGYSTP